MKPINLKRMLPICAALLSLTCGAQAVSYSFQNIEALGGNLDVVDQVTMDVVPGSVQDSVLFNFSVAAGNVGRISTIGFGDTVPASLVGSAVFTQLPGVSFTNAGNLNGPFSFTVDVNVDRVGGAANGIDPGESLGVQYGLALGVTYADVISALDDGSFNVGLHIVSLDGTGSGSQKAEVTRRVSVPDGGATMMLLGLALSGIGATRRFLLS